MSYSPQMSVGWIVQSNKVISTVQIGFHHEMLLFKGRTNSWKIRNKTKHVGGRWVGVIWMRSTRLNAS